MRGSRRARSAICTSHAAVLKIISGTVMSAERARLIQPICDASRWEHCGIRYKTELSLLCALPGHWREEEVAGARESEERSIQQNGDSQLQSKSPLPTECVFGVVISLLVYLLYILYCCTSEWHQTATELYSGPYNVFYKCGSEYRNKMSVRVCARISEVH